MLTTGRRTRRDREETGRGRQPLVPVVAMPSTK